MKERKIKNIVLCGATLCESGNFGDWLLQNLIEEKIREVIPDVNIMYIENHRYIKSIYRAMIKSDAFIYIPGGYLGYIEKWYSGSRIKTYQRVKYYYLPGIVYMLTKKPMALIGQGIGPFEYPVLQKMLSKICNYARLVCVRDKESYNLLRKAGVKNKIYVTADCSQVLKQYDLIYETKESRQIKTKLSGKKKIFVLFINNSEWNNKITKALKNLFADDNYGYVIGADSVLPERENLYNFAQHFPEEKTYVFDYREPRQLLSIYDEIDVVLTPKLHTAIIGCTMNKSVIDFAVQFAKTRLYFEKIGYPERVYDLFHINSQEMQDIIKKFINKQIDISEKIIFLSQTNYVLLGKFLRNGGD